MTDWQKRVDDDYEELVTKPQLDIIHKRAVMNTVGSHVNMPYDQAALIISHEPPAAALDCAVWAHEAQQKLLLLIPLYVARAEYTGSIEDSDE